MWIWYICPNFTNMKLWTILSCLTLSVKAKEWSMGCECGIREPDKVLENKCLMSAFMESSDQEIFNSNFKQGFIMYFRWRRAMNWIGIWLIWGLKNCCYPSLLCRCIVYKQQTFQTPSLFLLSFFVFLFHLPPLFLIFSDLFSRLTFLPYFLQILELLEAVNLGMFPCMPWSKYQASIKW